MVWCCVRGVCAARQRSQERDGDRPPDDRQHRDDGSPRNPPGERVGQGNDEEGCGRVSGRGREPPLAARRPGTTTDKDPRRAVEYPTRNQGDAPLTLASLDLSAFKPD